MLSKVALGVCPSLLEDSRLCSVLFGKVLQVNFTLPVDCIAPGDESSSKLAGSLGLMGNLKLLNRLDLLLVLLDRLNLVGGLCSLLFALLKTFG
jgi:hypothetical protein